VIHFKNKKNERVTPLRVAYRKIFSGIVEQSLVVVVVVVVVFSCCWEVVSNMYLFFYYTLPGRLRSRGTYEDRRCVRAKLQKYCGTLDHSATAVSLYRTIATTYHHVTASRL
jgi:hypothetical protein